MQKKINQIYNKYLDPQNSDLWNANIQQGKVNQNFIHVILETSGMY